MENDKPRAQHFNGFLKVHHRGADGAEYVDRYRDVSVVFYTDGWLFVLRVPAAGHHQAELAG